MYNVELHVVGGKHAGQVIPLDRKKFLIGRETDCQLRPNSELVSRHHCVFTVDDFSARLRDLGSTNGTLVNGERIRKEVVLQPGDKVIVGSLEFSVVVNENAQKSATGQLSAVSEETVVAGTDTLTEMTPIQTPNTEMPASEPQGAEATAANVGQTPAAEIPVQPPAPDAAIPEAPLANAGGDTTVIAPQQPMMMPGQVPYQPMMQQPMGYPQMYGGYPYAGMPGQMPMYPQQQMYPGQQMPGYPAQQPQPVADAPATDASAANVSLPDPSETGAKPVEPKPAASDGEQGAAPVNPAAAIIQQHRQRRPGG